MNRLKLIFAACLAVLVIAPSAFAQQKHPTVKEVYEEGKRAYLGKDYEKALKAFEYVKKYYPRDPRVRSYIAKTQMALKEDRPRASMEAQLRAVVIPSVEFEDATLDTVLEYLTQKTEELSGGKIRPNFVYRGSPQEKAQGGITLKLNHVPVSEVIRYVGQITRTQFKYEQYAITGVPLRMLSPVQPETPAPAETESFDPFA
ncbi:MAG: hypothetical protein AAGH89_10740 [Verrucomicrobiota bacterium]